MPGLITTGTAVGVAALADAATAVLAVLLAVLLDVAAVAAADVAVADVLAANVVAVLAVAVEPALVAVASGALAVAAVVVPVVTATDPPQAARSPRTELVAKRDRQVRRVNRTACMYSSLTVNNPASVPPAGDCLSGVMFACSLVRRYHMLARGVCQWTSYNTGKAGVHRWR